MRVVDERRAGTIRLSSLSRDTMLLMQSAMSGVAPGWDGRLIIQPSLAEWADSADDVTAVRFLSRPGY